MVRSPVAHAPHAVNLSSSDQLLLALLLDLPEGERTAYLQRACADNPSLNERMPAILDALAATAQHVPSNSPVGLDDSARLRLAETALHPERSESPGTHIGPYKLLQQIGEGGFGSVWMAEQESPVRRRVALKAIKPGMDTKEVIARFEAERQALAMMEHPNIAHVFDAGATTSGRPYFVMELVRGVPITRYCDDARLPTEARLRLFITVCHAVQHAHQKGIIHRDLKPSNVLVTLHDGTPVPKIIDFGVAKATGSRLTDKTLFTRFHAFVGTPVYTSPEQMEMSGLDVDTRSDIYSLGVLLYELLTGRPPFDAEALAKSGLEAMRRTIREVDPPEPSRHLATLSDADRTSVARQRRTDPARLSVLLRGDLDWVVMRCLEKDRTRRYDTAASLAEEVERFLRNDTVLARPPSSVYRLGKFVRRHRVAVGAAVAVTVALLVGLIASSALLIRERQAHAREVEARRRAVASEQAEVELRRQAELARQAETIRASRTARDLAERLLAEGRASEGLAWLVHAARKNPADTTIGPRLASVLTSRNFFLPAAPPIKFPSRVASMHYLDSGKKLAVYCDDGTTGIIDLATGNQAVSRLPTGLKAPGVVIAGKVTVVRGNDDVIRVLAPATGRVEREFNFGQKIAGITAHNTEAPVIVALLEDQSVVVADAISGRTLTMPFQHPPGRSMGLSPDGHWLVRGGASPIEGELWDARSGEIRGHGAIEGPGRCGCFNPDSTRLLIVNRVDPARSRFQVLSVPDLQPLTASGDLTEPEFHGNAFLVAEFSPDSRWFVIASQTSYQIFDTATGARVGPLVKAGLLSKSSISERDSVVAAAGLEERFRPPRIVYLSGRWCCVSASPLDARVEMTVRELATGRAIYPPLTYAAGIADAKLSEDGNTLIGIGMDGCVLLWDLRTGRRLAESPSLTGSVDQNLAMRPDGRELVTGLADGTVQRKRAALAPARPLVLPRGRPPALAWFISGTTQLLWLTQTRAVVVDLTTGNAVGDGFAFPSPVEGGEAALRDLAARDDLRFMVARTAAGSWQAWELDQRGIKRTIPLEEAPSTPAWIAFSPRDDLVALISVHHLESVRFWKLTTGKPATAELTHTTAILTQNVRAADFSPDGRLFARGGINGTITIWDVATGQRRFALNSPRVAAIAHLEFSPDGQSIVASDTSGVARVWDASRAQPLAEIPRAVMASFSPAGDRLLAGRGDTVRVFDRATGAEIGAPMVHPGVGIRAAVFSADGRRVATGAQDSTARIWDAATGLPLSDPLTHGFRVAGCAFSPDGRFVRTEDASGRFLFWSVPPDGNPVPAPEWLLQLATACSAKKIDDAGQYGDAPEAFTQIDDVRHALEPQTNGTHASGLARDPFAEWGRWILNERPDRSIAPGFLLTPADADRLEESLLAGAPFPFPSAHP